MTPELKAVLIQVEANLENISRMKGSFDKIECIMTISAASQIAFEALAALKPFMGEANES